MVLALALAGALLVHAPSVGRRSAGPTALPAFTVVERFGVAHPDQIIDFDLKAPIDPARHRLLDASGREVAYQLLAGGRRLAVRTDLPARATRSWRLVAGRPAADMPDAVTVREAGDFYEVTNGIAGVRVTRAAPIVDPASAPAPVQGIRLRDGAWTALGPNVVRLHSTPNDKGVGAFRSMQVRFLERGPLVTTLEVSYRCDRPATWHPDRDIAPRGRAAGPGFYRSTITLQAGQPSILFEEHTDMDLSASLDCWAGLAPNQARYRGHSAPAKEYGYEEGGGVYRPVHMRPAMDAFVDLPYDRPRLSGLYSTPDHWAKLVVWNPWASGTGWYWMFTNREAPESANLLGIFTGRASRALDPLNSGVGLFTRPAPAGGVPSAGLTISTSRWNPNRTFSPIIRFQWGLFVGTKRDLLPPSAVQPIARQMNLHGGIQLNKLHRWMADFPDPPGGYGAMYLKPDVLRRIRARVRQDDAWDRFLRATTWGENHRILDMWRDPSGRAAREAARGIADLAHSLLDALVNKDGIYEFAYHYWHGGLAMQRAGDLIAQALDDPSLTRQERASLKRAAALFAQILWDNDFVPMDNYRGINMGTANMPQMQQGFRQFYALLLSGHPEMRQRLKAIAAGMRSQVRQLLNEHGAPFSGSGYQHAAMQPPLGTMLALKRLGLADVFREEPRLARYAEFYMSLLSPPDPRFGKGWRQHVCIGDTSIGVGGNHFPGMLATGLADVQPRRAARLTDAWKSTGGGYSDFFGPGVIRANPFLPSAPMALRSDHFPGYCSVLRSAFGAPNETTVWMLNGEFLQDHRHYDMGSLIVWALGAPLSVDMGTSYNPYLAGATLHSLPIPETALGRPWTAEQKDLNECQFMAGAPEPAAFAAFRMSSATATTFRRPAWRRSVRLVHGNPEQPVIVVEDRFPDVKAGPWVLHWNLMADAGAEVNTPAGPYRPEPRFYSSQGRPDGPKQMPSTGPVFALAPGCHRLAFRGPMWGVLGAAQPSIDWDLYLVTGEPQEALIGNWAHEGLASGAQEFQETNQRPFEERQHLLRVRGREGFTTLLLPYRKGRPPEGRTVSVRDGVVQIVWRDEETLVGPEWHAYRRSGDLTMLALAGGGRAAYRGLGIAGGPAELIEDRRAGTLTITLHGAAGARALTLPRGWQPDRRLQRTRDGWTVRYAGGAPLTIRLRQAGARRAAAAGRS